tara:strand:- start:923 stop:1099 length:177 start_codon:yes stop_codon:yes gene_type:complete
MSVFKTNFCSTITILTHYLALDSNQASILMSSVLLFLGLENHDETYWNPKGHLMKSLF